MNIDSSLIKLIRSTERLALHILLTAQGKCLGMAKNPFFHWTDSPCSHIQMVAQLPKHNTQLYMSTSYGSKLSMSVAHVPLKIP